MNQPSLLTCNYDRDTFPIATAQRTWPVAENYWLCQSRFLSQSRTIGSAADN